MSTASGTAASAPPRVVRDPGRVHQRVIPLVWRVFVANASVLTAATLVLALGPVTVSRPLALSEAIVLVSGLLAMLVVNLLLTRRLFAPLQRLSRLMLDVDPLAPGRRIGVEGRDHEVRALAAAFDGMLDRLETERRDSARRALGAQESERARVARELHDEVGQAVTGLLLGLERAARQAPVELSAMLGELREDARSNLDDVRRIARELRPEALDDLGLLGALSALGARIERDASLQIERRLSPSTALSREAELVIYRVAQEALTNAVRHADAGRVELILESTDRTVVLRVRDDGHGFDPHHVEGAGEGIRGMRERAVLADARLTLDAAPGRGTELRLEVPVA